MGQIVIEGVPIEIQRKPIKNMYLRVRRPDGLVSVSAPLHLSDVAVEGFICSRLPWIRAKRTAIADVQHLLNHEYVTGETVHLWGCGLDLQVDQASRWSVMSQGGSLYLSAPPASTVEQRQAHVREWHRACLVEAAEPLFEKWEDRTGLAPDEWRTKHMKSRWGTCNVKARRIWLNVELAYYPLDCLDYVILHELAHLRVPSHGPAFKAILDEYMPSWREVRKTLRDRNRA